MSKSRIEALQAVPVFGGVRSDILQYLISNSELVSLAKDRYFFHEGDQAEAMFVLETGEVSVIKQWNDKPFVLRHLRRGDCFGEMALMDLFPRSASIRAETQCTAMQISMASFHKLYEKDVEQFTLIQMNIGREVSRRLRTADDQLFRVKMGETALEVDTAFHAT